MQDQRFFQMADKSPLSWTALKMDAASSSEASAAAYQFMWHRIPEYLTLYV